MSDNPNEVDLVVRVSNKNGVNAYGFAYAGKPVTMSHGEGHFHATKNKTGLLEWGMEGEPGGYMKVEVLRDESVIKSREQSQIVPPNTKSYDAFAIVIA